MVDMLASHRWSLLASDDCLCLGFQVLEFGGLLGQQAFQSSMVAVSMLLVLDIANMMLVLLRQNYLLFDGKYGSVWRL